MRTLTTMGGIETFVTLREGKWLTEHDAEKVYRKDLTEREQLIAQGMVRKGLLNRHIRNGETYYTKNVNKVMS